MIPVSEDYKKGARSGVRIWRTSLIEVGEDANKVFQGDDKLSSVKLEASASWLGTGMKKLAFTLLTLDEDLVGRTFRLKSGLKLSNGNWEDLDYGTFLVTEQLKNLEAKKTEFVAFDNMVKFCVPYNSENHVFPCKVHEFIQQICVALSVENGMAGEDAKYLHKDLDLPVDYFAKINGLTYRDVLTQIAEATATTALIGRDDKLYLKKLAKEPVEQLTDAEMRKFKVEPKYGAVNTLVLAREPQGDKVVAGLGAEESATPWIGNYAGWGDRFIYDSLNLAGFAPPRFLRK